METLGGWPGSSVIVYATVSSSACSSTWTSSNEMDHEQRPGSTRTTSGRSSAKSSQSIGNKVSEAELRFGSRPQFLARASLSMLFPAQVRSTLAIEACMI